MFDWLLSSSYRGIISSVLGMLAGFCAAILLNSAVSAEKLFTLSLLVSVIVFVLVHFILETYTKQELVYEKDWVSVYNRKIDFSDTFSLIWVTKSHDRVTLTPSTILTKSLFEELKRYSSGNLVGKVTHKQNKKQSSAYVIMSEVVDLKNLDSYLTKVEYRKLKGYRNRLGFLRGDVQEFETIKGVLRLTFEQEKAETIFD
jgi:hypothetical protein